MPSTVISVKSTEQVQVRLAEVCGSARVTANERQFDLKEGEILDPQVPHQTDLQQEHRVKRSRGMKSQD